MHRKDSQVDGSVENCASRFNHTLFQYLQNGSAKSCILRIPLMPSIDF